MVSKRINQLVIPKKLHPDYRPAREVLRKVPITALTAMPTERILSLALPKRDHPDYWPSKTVGIYLYAKAVHSEWFKLEVK